MITLVIGGDKSGKSDFALSRLLAAPGPKAMLATGEARDFAFRRQIADHRRTRPPEVRLIEVRRGLPEILDAELDRICSERGEAARPDETVRPEGGAALAAGPLSAADPITSVGPIESIGPIGSVEPAASVGPMASVNPTAAGEPMTSIGPITSIGPMAPTGPMASDEPADGAILVDSLDFWLFSVGGDESAVSDFLRRLEAWPRSARAPELLLVSAEVGLGPLAATAETRRFVRALGAFNQSAARLADRVFFMVAGLPLAVKGG